MPSDPMSSLSVIDSSPIPRKKSVPKATEHGNSTSQAPTTTTLDFVGSGHAVKDLFSLPYTDRPISVVVHNLGGTLLVDADPDEERVDQNRQSSSIPSHDSSPITPLNLSETKALVSLTSLESKSESLAIVNSIIESSHKAAATGESSESHLKPQLNKVAPASDALGLPTPDDYVARYIPPVSEPREYVSWNFRDMKLLVGSDSVVYRSPETALAVRVEETQDLKAMVHKHQEMVRSGEFIADHQFAKLQQAGKPSYVNVASRREVPQIEQQKGISSPSRATGKASPSFAAPDLDEVRLQTCIVPSPHIPVGGLMRSGSGVVPYEKSTPPRSASPVSTVLDTYLDNIMANVPQLALCLQEKGFVQSLKLLNTEHIPSALMKPETTDTSNAFEILKPGKPTEQIFSPEIMEMNASTLLRFLKTQCSKDNATYLLRREAGDANVQLYDISSIPAQRKQKWNWWLAMMSNRFANRLKSLAASTSDHALKRTFRARERSLLQNTLELLEALADMDGTVHESLTAAVNENLAETFLAREDDDENDDQWNDDSPCQPSPVTSVSLQQPYANIPVDALNKAQDFLLEGIRVLTPTLDKSLERLKKRSRGRQSRSASKSVVVTSIGSGSDSDSSGSDPNSSLQDKEEKKFLMEISPVAMQLFGMHHKLVSISLRLAEIHLKNYYSSSAMHSLRTASRRIGDSLYLTQLVAKEGEKRTDRWMLRIQLQYTWLWEHCGHFARSFAADPLWRERGHASGEDVVSVLQDVDCALRGRRDIDITDSLVSNCTNPRDLLSEKSMGLISLCSLNGVVGCRISETEGKTSWFDDDRVDFAEKRLRKQRLLIKEQRRVLIAACIAYGRSIDSYRRIWSSDENNNPKDGDLLALLRQRLGDAYNETGKVFMNEVRTLLATLPANKEDFDEEAALAADPLLCSAEFWFLEGLAVFTECNDLRNVALLRCNLCQCWKLRANAIFADEESKPADGSTHPEVCLQEAANQLQAAHENLSERDTDPVTWDMVSGELAATFLVLGVRRRQSLVGSGNIPLVLQAFRLSPGRERSIVEPMERALAIYQQSRNHHQAAAAHYQLALFYSKIWTCQRDEAKTREKLGSAFQHYNAAHAFFSQAIKGNEPTFCLLCLDLSNLYSTVSGKECLAKALLRCIDTVVAFHHDAISAATQDLSRSKEWLKKMDTLASSVEERTFKILRNLVKLEESGELEGSVYKELYRVGLRAKMTASKDANDDPIVQRLLVVHGILAALSKQLADANDGAAV